MSEFETYHGTESGESYDPAAFELFKERVRKNGAFIAAQKKSEQKQKKKEDKLAQILLAFIQKDQRRDILILAAEMLRENVPPSFILSVLLLGNTEIKKEAGELLLSQGPSGEKPESELPIEFERFQFPLSLKMELNEWIQTLFETAKTVPYQILERTLDEHGNVKPLVITFIASVLRDFLMQEKVPNVPLENCREFSEFLFQSLLSRIKNVLERQKELQEGVTGE